MWIFLTLVLVIPTPIITTTYLILRHLKQTDERVYAERRRVDTHQNNTLEMDRANRNLELQIELAKIESRQLKSPLRILHEGD